MVYVNRNIADRTAVCFGRQSSSVGLIYREDIIAVRQSLQTIRYIGNINSADCYGLIDLQAARLLIGNSNGIRSFTRRNALAAVGTHNTVRDQPPVDRYCRFSDDIGRMCGNIADRHSARACNGNRNGNRTAGRCRGTQCSARNRQPACTERRSKGHVHREIDPCRIRTGCYGLCNAQAARIRLIFVVNCCGRCGICRIGQYNITVSCNRC